MLGAILGPLAERYFNTTMIASGNDWTVFFTRPISAVLMVIWVAVLGFLVYRGVAHARRQRTGGAAGPREGDPQVSTAVSTEETKNVR